MLSLDVIKFEMVRLQKILGQKNLDTETSVRLRKDLESYAQIDLEIRRKLKENPDSIKQYKSDIELSVSKYKEDCIRIARAGDKETAKLIAMKKKIAEEELNRLNKSN